MRDHKPWRGASHCGVRRRSVLDTAGGLIGGDLLDGGRDLDGFVRSRVDEPWRWTDPLCRCLVALSNLAEAPSFGDDLGSSVLEGAPFFPRERVLRSLRTNVVWREFAARREGRKGFAGSGAHGT